MYMFPIDERRIAEVEQGRCCEAVVPLPSEGTLVAGDAVLFALSASRAGREPEYVPKGDSIVVSLTGVTDLGMIDPATGRALVQLSWNPLGRTGTLETKPGRAAKPRRPRDDV
jgi:hypothetical protein